MISIHLNYSYDSERTFLFWGQLASTFSISYILESSILDFSIVIPGSFEIVSFISNCNNHAILF